MSQLNDAQTREAQKRVEALTRLLQSEGWKMFDSYLEGAQKMQERELASAISGDRCLKAAGSLTTLLEARRWAQQELAANLQYLQRK